MLYININLIKIIQEFRDPFWHSYPSSECVIFTYFVDPSLLRLSAPSFLTGVSLLYIILYSNNHEFFCFCFSLQLASSGVECSPLGKGRVPAGVNAAVLLERNFTSLGAPGRIVHLFLHLLFLCFPPQFCSFSFTRTSSCIISNYSVNPVLWLLSESCIQKFL